MPSECLEFVPRHATTKGAAKIRLHMFSGLKKNYAMPHGWRLCLDLIELHRAQNEEG